MVEVVSPDDPTRDYRYKRCSTVFARGNAGVSPAYSTLAAGVSTQLSGASPMSDCIKKRSEYAVRGIPEYWIVDPEQKKVIILTLVEGFYDEIVFEGEQKIISSTFPNFTLQSNQILLLNLNQ